MSTILTVVFVLLALVVNIPSLKKKLAEESEENRAGSDAQVAFEAEAEEVVSSEAVAAEPMQFDFSDSEASPSAEADEAASPLFSEGFDLRRAVVWQAVLNNDYINEANNKK